MTNHENLPVESPEPSIHEGVMSDQYLQPRDEGVERVDLSAGEQFEVDTDTIAYDNSEFGLPKTLNDGNTLTIAGKIEIAGDSASGTPESTLAIVKSVGIGSATEIFLYSRNQDTGTEKWTSLPANVKFSVGRSVGTEDNPDKRLSDPRFLDGEKLTGKDFSRYMSRNQFEIENIYGKGLVVTSISETMQTSVEARPYGKEQRDQKIGSGVIATVTPNLIDMVPKDNEELEKMGAEEQAAKNAEIRSQIDSLDEEMKALKKGLSEKDAMALWKYASGLINKKEAQIAGDGNASYAYESQAGEGLKEMSPAADAVKSKYMNLMQRNSSLIAQLQ